MFLSKFFLYSAGLYLSFAFDDLSIQRFASQIPIFPSQDSYLLYEASNAVDRNTTTCMRTNAIGNNAPHKHTWWKVDLGAVYNIYSIDILFKNYDNFEYRQRGRLAGFSLYVSNTDVSSNADIKGSTLCYKDGPQLPTLNFTTTCTEYGRYVIFYNERLDGVTYPLGYTIEVVFTELCEVIVKGCKRSSVYGSACDIPCPATCKNKTCHIQSGVCLVCEPGVYGSYCNISCPVNCNDNTCHGQNGTCFTCKLGWIGIYCKTTCTNGWYGANCSQRCSEHCRNNTPCNHVTGHCDKGCDKGWTGPLCNEECDDETYGYNCMNNCSGHCLNNSACNKQTGNCDLGCKLGYTNDDCSKGCERNFFGLDCRELCSGHCNNNDQCDHISGVCPDGCQDGYMDKYCKSPCKAGNYGKNCTFHCSSNCNETCNHPEISCRDCEEGWLRHCSKVNDAAHTGLVYTPSNNLPITVGVIVGTGVALTVGVVIFIFILRLKRKATILNKRESIIMEVKPPIKTRQISDRKPHDDKTNDHANTTYALPEKTKRGPPTNKNISVRNISAQISNMSANENAGFKNEYHDIPRGELHPCTEAKNPINKVKNRYTTIYPYDHSRIILKPPASDGSGYINANYIENSQGRRLYIATQGPKPKTIADFWTMIWQEEVCNIVCLTNLTEGTKNKCAQYWPDVNDKLQGGTLTVRHLEEKTYAEYIIRRFKIHNQSTKSDRHVTMFHYTTWSDHGVADPLSLVVFHRHVIRATVNSAGKYTVVHCSAGVGRTGTYIALDALYREGERTGKINVPMYVRTMRKDRMNMIQGDDQYKLIYLALKDAFYGQKKCLETEIFLEEYQEQTFYTNSGDISQRKSLSSDLEELLSLRKEYTQQQDYISGRAQISANYTENVLPVEEFMCHLYYMKGYNTYYNAVLIQSYLEKDSLISAQYPLPDNTEDFLRLIKDFDARVVVFLCPLEDIGSTSKWFPPENQYKFNGIFYVKNMSSTRSHNVKMTRLNIQPTGFNEMDITLLECPTWGERQKKGDKRVLLDVIKAVKTEKSDHKGRVLVLSRDGATRCGPFFVVYNVLEQISVDREVDIFTAVRQIQIRRPECVSTVDEYKLCHDAIAEYLLNDCVYGNC